MSGGAHASKLLLVDDDDTFRRVMSAELVRRGHDVSVAATGEEAIDAVAALAPDLLLLDLRLPDLDGLEVLRRLRERQQQLGVIVLTGHGTIDTAIQAIRMGAYDYLEKPCPIAKVELAIRKAREHMALLERQRVLQDGYSPPDVRPGLVGASAAFLELRQTVSRVARSDSTTLIIGETGSGKEMVATLLHAESHRKDAPFVVVDCAALDEDLLRSELFGHEKGAFTGATRQKHGLLEVAHGGTLFLDEVGDAASEIQSKLLRVLETGRFRRVGGTRELAVDVRVVSATNRDLEEAVRAGRFREDLFFRLSTLTIRVPPLRERVDDIPVLVEHYARLLGRRLGATARFSDEAISAMTAYSWPGNVRELIHVVEQAMVLGSGPTIGRDDLPASVLAGGESQPAPAAAGSASLLPLKEIQRRHVLSVVGRVGGNRTRAAEILQVSERNLRRLLKKYESPPDDGDAETDLDDES